MTRRRLAIAALSFLAITGCVMSFTPVSEVRPMTAGSMERALRAAVSAAMSTEWVPKTISAETGYLMAERSNPHDEPYRLELLIPAGGSGSLSVKVTPLNGRRNDGDESGAAVLAKSFLAALDSVVASAR
ncbi:MAG: hypothetical protein ABJE47_17820 [bacterium]